MLFVQLRNLHVSVFFGVVDNLTVPPMVRTLFIDRYVKGIFPIERRIVPIQSYTVASISEYMPVLDLRAILQDASDAETITDDRQDNCKSTPVFRVERCVAVSPNTE